MHNSKYQCHMAASCTCHLPTITSKLLSKRPCTKSCSSRITPRELSGEKAEQWTVSRKMTRQKEQED